MDIIECPIPSYKKLDILEECKYIELNSRQLLHMYNIDEASVEVDQKDSYIYRNCDLLQFKRERIELDILVNYLIKDISLIISEYLDFLQITNGYSILNITNFNTFCLPICYIVYNALHIVGEHGIIKRRETSISEERRNKLFGKIIKLNFEVNEDQVIDDVYDIKKKKINEVYNQDIKLLYKSYVYMNGQITLCGFY